MKIYKKYLASILSVAIVLAVFTGISCSMTPEGVSVLSGDYVSPKFLSFEMVNENQANLYFSKDVQLENIRVANVENQNSVDFEKKNLGSGTWILNFTENLDCATSYSIEGNVKDESGNSLYFKDQFQGYNSRVPNVVLNEIREGTYSQGKYPKYEFIELKVLSDGNLGGMQLISAYDTEGRAYILPSAEVKAGEFVVIHYRKASDDVTQDELGSDTTISTGNEAGSWRDLWVNSEKACLGASDVILLKNRVNGNIVDAVLYSNGAMSEWKTEYLKKCAQEAFDCGVWESGAAIQDACNTQNVTPSRTLCRITTDSNGKDSWIVVNTGKNSMGKENSSEEYVKPAETTSEDD